MTHRTLITLFVGTLAFSGQAFAQSCGAVLTSDTLLAGPLTCPGTALELGADDIELDCNGHLLTGPGAGIGVLLDGRSGVTVKNCQVRNYAVGILLTNSSGNYLTANGVGDGTSAGNGGFQLSNGSDGNVLKYNRSWNNAGRGFVIANSEGNLLMENGSSSNGMRGFDLINAPGNALIGNWINGNTSAGIVVQGAGSTGNILHENQVAANSSEGLAMFTGFNYLSFNQTDQNNTWGVRDSSGPNNVYLLNGCVGNGSGTSAPFGLCFP